jgi:DNA-binding beta-propeller fold protein YncE
VVGFLSVSRTTPPIIEAPAGPAATQLVLGNGWSLPPGATPTVGVVALPNVWLGLVENMGAPSATSSMAEVNPQTGEITRSVSLMGEPTAATASGSSLWITTINEFDPSGTTLTKVDTSSAEASVVDRLGRAATVSASGDLLWVIQDLSIQLRDATTGELLQNVDTTASGGWVAAFLDGVAWTTDPRANAVHELQNAVEQRSLDVLPMLGRPSLVAASSESVFVVGEKAIGEISTSAGQIVRTFSVGDSSRQISIVNNRLWLLAQHQITMIDLSTGATFAQDLPTASVAYVLAVVDPDTSIVCFADGLCQTVSVAT